MNVTTLRTHKPAELISKLVLNGLEGLPEPVGEVVVHLLGGHGDWRDPRGLRNGGLDNGRGTRETREAVRPAGDGWVGVHAAPVVDFVAQAADPLVPARENEVRKVKERPGGGWGLAVGLGD